MVTLILITICFSFLFSQASPLKELQPVTFQDLFSYFAKQKSLRKTDTRQRRNSDEKDRKSNENDRKSSRKTKTRKRQNSEKNVDDVEISKRLRRSPSIEIVDEVFVNVKREDGCQRFV
jgi:hypothetical protein